MSRLDIQCKGCNYMIEAYPCYNCKAIKEHQEYLAGKMPKWLTKENMVKARNGDLVLK